MVGLVLQPEPLEHASFETDRGLDRWSKEEQLVRGG
jgi:hypothetical protein